MKKSGLPWGWISKLAFNSPSCSVHLDAYNKHCILLLNTNPAGLGPVLHGVCDLTGNLPKTIEYRLLSTCTKNTNPSRILEKAFTRDHISQPIRVLISYSGFCHLPLILLHIILIRFTFSSLPQTPPDLGQSSAGFAHLVSKRKIEKNRILSVFGKAAHTQNATSS